MNRFNLTEGDFCETNAIMVNGNLYDIGVPVVRWADKGGFDAYSTATATYKEEDRKTGKVITKSVSGKRYQARKQGILSINQFMLHHTGGFTASTCFNTLHNNRKLSVHYILDDIGKVYQTLDVKELAWHGGAHNNQSVGVECVLYPDAEKNPSAYSSDRLTKFSLAPHDSFDQYIQKDTRHVFALPEYQVEALARLVAGTWVAVANERKQVPDAFLEPPMLMRGPDSNILMDYTTSAKQHTGMLLHANASEAKWDLAGIQDMKRFENITSDYFHSFQEALR
jgi:hypothetical protein